MDQISPALQFGLDKVETCSWESSSPHSLDESVHNTSSCPQEQGSSPCNLAEPEMYSVMTVESHHPNESRETSPEPLSPSNLQILHDPDCIACKEELEETSSDYSCGMPMGNAGLLEGAESNGEEVRAKKEYHDLHASSSLDPIGAFGEYPSHDHPNQVITLAPPPPPPSAAEPLTPDDICAIPPCLRYGTYLPPERQDKTIIVALEGAELWHQFYLAGTEMIITKSGR